MGTPHPPEIEGGFVHSRKPLGNFAEYSVLEKESPAEAGLKLRFTLLAAFSFSPQFLLTF